MISRKITAQVRGELVRTIEELRDAIGSKALLLRGGGDRMADFVDQAAAEHDQSVEMMIQSRAGDRIREMEDTIKRIDQGQFGVCCRCGAEIPIRRLRLTPSSRLCTVCMNRLEKESGGHPYRPFSPRIDRRAA